MNPNEGWPPFFEEMGPITEKEIESFRVSLVDSDRKKMMEFHLQFTDGSEKGMLVDHKTAKYFIRQLKFALDTYKELTR